MKRWLLQPGRLHEFCAATPAGEAAFIVRQIEALLGGSSHREVERLGTASGSFALGDIAVLYRTGRQAEILATALTGHGFPVQVVDVVPFYLSAPASVLYRWALLAAGQAEGAAPAGPAASRSRVSAGLLWPGLSR